MNKQFLPLLVLALGVTAAGSAQEKEKPNKGKESITIRKKTDSKEKTTIVIDGDKITVNGKPIEELKDGEIEVLRNKHMSEMMPLLKEKLISGGGVKMFGGDRIPFKISSRALLGVVSEKDDKGAKITSVTKESAAEKAGLKKDDIITKVGDTKIENSEDLYEAIGDHKPEDKVTIAYLRDGKPATTTATLGKTSSEVRSFSFNGDDFNMDKLREELPRMKERLREMPRMQGMDGLRAMPKMEGFEFYGSRRPRLGLEIQDVEEGKGVKILDVDSDTPASKAGLQKDDVISEVDGKTIASVDELKEKLKDLKEGDSIKITYKRGGQTQTTDLKLPKKLKTADL